MNFTPHTSDEIKEMLKSIGANSIEELFNTIPENLRAKSFDIPKGLSEYEVVNILKKLSEKNADNTLCFMGGGVYDHIIPSVVDSISSKPEFYTAYTPYQPEASQGTLQALYEYQTAICQLTGMDASNASMYDGATACAEAALMAMRCTRKSKIIIDETVNPLFRETVKTYLKNMDCEVIEIKHNNYTLNYKELEKHLDNKTAGVILQNPNFFGTIEDHTEIIEKIDSFKALAIECVYPTALSLIKSPGEDGAHITVGEAQCLGNPLSFGGPYLGFIACKKKYIRNLPGRIAGQTVDKNDKRGWVLTLQAREQHIKRQRATSNICSNQNLCALRALIYLSSIGKEGFKTLGDLIYNKTQFAINELGKIKGVEILNNGPVFNEFIIKVPMDINIVIEEMLKKGIAPGISLNKYYKNSENILLVAITEKRTKEDILTYAKSLEEIICK